MFAALVGLSTIHGYQVLSQDPLFHYSLPRLILTVLICFISGLMCLCLFCVIYVYRCTEHFMLVTVHSPAVTLITEGSAL